MLIKSCTKENDTVEILFGGSGSEIILCKKLNRNFISSEIHKPYYDMIIDRLENGESVNKKYTIKAMHKLNLQATYKKQTKLLAS